VNEVQEFDEKANFEAPITRINYFN